MALTAKGQFVLDCLHQGINVSHAEFDALWEQAQEGQATTKQCPTCHGTGRVTKNGGSDE